MAIRQHPHADNDAFWRRSFFSDHKPTYRLPRKKHDITGQESVRVGASGELWATRLFQGGAANEDPHDKLAVIKNGAVVHEIPVQRMGDQTVVGRHPSCDLQLESYKLALYHLVIHRKEGKLYVESLDFEAGALINRKKLKSKTAVQLFDGDQIDMPGYRLQFSIAGSLHREIDAPLEADELDEIPEFFYTPPPPPPSPLLAHLVHERETICVWTEGTTTVKVVDIIEETHDCKTFRLVGEEPLMFSYKPGQFVTFLLDIDGREVKRSYSMSSSPSRPHLLEITIKRVPGGLVSNWFCDHIKLGDRLTIKGPAGKFTCFDFPAGKMLFIGAGSGITPLLSMSRWIADTASDVDVKLVASFKSPTDIIFRKEFELLAARHRGFQVAVTVTSGWHGTDTWTGFRGRIGAEMINILAPDIKERHVFLCGPEPFAEAVKSILRNLDFDMANFHTESFGSGRSAQAVNLSGPSLQLQGPRHTVTFTKSGKSVKTDEQVSLLELAEAHGIELDYSCRTGSCGECEVKCKGKVQMSDTCEIDAATREAGFVYACCCTALTDLELEV